MTDVRQCACGVLYTQAEWDALKPQPWDLGDVRLEMAECVCGSSITVERDIERDEHRRDEGDDALAEVLADRERERAEGWW